MCGSIGNRQGEVNLFPQALPHLLNPCSRIGAVDNTPQKSQAFGDVVTDYAEYLLW